MARVLMAPAMELSSKRDSSPLSIHSTIKAYYRVACISKMGEITDKVQDASSILHRNKESKKGVKRDVSVLKHRAATASSMLKKNDARESKAKEEILIIDLSSDEDDITDQRLTSTTGDNFMLTSTPAEIKVHTSKHCLRESRDKSTSDDEIANQDTLPISTPELKMSASSHPKGGLNQQSSPPKRRRLSTNNLVSLPSSDGETNSPHNASDYDLEWLVNHDSEICAISAEAIQKINKVLKKRQSIQFSESNNPTGSKANEPRLAEAAVQVEIPDPKHLTRIAALESRADQLKRSLEEHHQEIGKLKDNLKRTEEAHASVLSEKEKEIESLKNDFGKKESELQRSLTEKSQELEKLKEELRQKEISFVAASLLLGLSHEEIVRKSVEAQIAQAASAQKSSLLIREPMQMQQASQNSQCTVRRSDSDEQDASITSNQSIDQQIPASSYVRNVPCKGELKRRNSCHVNGVYADAFPLQEEVLDHHAKGSNAPEFVRSLMRHCFTDEFLKSSSMSKMALSQIEAITDATLARFNEYRTRKDTVSQTLNRPTVRKFISNVFKSKHTKRTASQ